MFSYPGIVEHHYRFCEWLLPKISKFQRDQRYILGSRLQNTALDVLEGLIDVTIAPREEKYARLAQTSRSLEHLRFLFRLAFSIRMINSKSYEYGCGALVETGRMLGGWLNSTSPRGLEGQPPSGRARHGNRQDETSEPDLG